MEYRKLIKFGNSSFIISIPGKWLKRNKLSKGDVVYLEEDGESRLILYSNFEKEKKESEALIDTKNKNIGRVVEEIYRAYTDGFDVIKLIGDDINLISENIRKVMNNFVAVEIIEQTGNKIIAKNFLNIKDVKIKDVIRRIDIILRSMLRDSIECIGENKCDGIVQRDVDINRLCFMLERILKTAMNDPEISRKIDIRGIELLHVWYIVMNLESIGDEVKRISRFLDIIDLNTKQMKEIKIIYENIEKSYLDVMKAYYKSDKKLAFDVSNRKNELHEQCNKFFEKNQILRVGGMIEKMKAMVSWIKTISLVSYE
ncbi:MAG: hypothetical protein CMH62_03225 [Nanoarchaeota archaeon]|nr:hypothetical protein [Nanoarchaeota archaeon]